MFQVLQGNPFAMMEMDDRTNGPTPRVIHFEKQADARYICSLLNKKETQFERCARCDQDVRFKADGS